MIIYGDPPLSADETRRELYAGNLVVRNGLPGVAAFVEHTRGQLAELFAPHDPEHAHEHYSPEELAKILGVWKPSFIHDPRSKEIVRQIVQEAGFPAEHTYYDVPKPRTAFPEGHLTTGIAYAFPWHRDIWYAAPPQQINWWLPIFAVGPNNAMSFDPVNFERPVHNDSHLFDYYELNAGRATIAKQVGKEVQARPAGVGHHTDNEVIVLPPPGSVLLFSAAHLHATIPNTSGRSRFSIDFRTVDARDVVAGQGGPVVDVNCYGTAIRDFHRVADDSAFDEETVVEIFGAPPEGAQLVYEPR
jgi:hypothetical protein